MADACPTCGRPAQLPTITPEMLYFRSSAEGAQLPRVVAWLPDGSAACAFAGVIYAMPAAEWETFQVMQAGAAAFAARVTA